MKVQPAGHADVRAGAAVWESGRRAAGLVAAEQLGQARNRSRRPRPWSGQSGWHVAAWGPWGWSETLIKLVAVAIAVVAAGDGAASIPATNAVTYWALVLIAIGYLGTAVDRARDREVVAMAFVVATIIGHWSIVWAMGRPDWPADQVRAFTSLMIIGDLVKIGYFTVTDVQVRDLPKRLPIALTGCLVVVYGVALALA